MVRTTLLESTDGLTTSGSGHWSSNVPVGKDTLDVSLTFLVIPLKHLYI